MRELQAPLLHRISVFQQIPSLKRGEAGEEKKKERKKKHTPKSIEEVEEACGNKEKWGPPGTHKPPLCHLFHCSLRTVLSTACTYKMNISKQLEIENVGFGWGAYEPLLNLLFSNSSSTAWLFEPKITSDVGPLVLKLRPSLSRGTPLGSLQRDPWLCKGCSRHLSHEVIVSDSVAMCWGCQNHSWPWATFQTLDGLSWAVRK